MEVGDNKVLILADSAERAEEVDVERAEAARRRAEESIAGRQTTMDLEEAQASLRRANFRCGLASGVAAPIAASER